MFKLRLQFFVCFGLGHILNIHQVFLLIAQGSLLAVLIGYFLWGNETGSAMCGKQLNPCTISQPHVIILCDINLLDLEKNYKP